MTPQPNLNSGSYLIPEVTSNKQLLSKAFLAFIVRRINALTRMRVVSTPHGDGVLRVSDWNSILPIGGSGTSTGSAPSGSASFRVKAVYDNFVLGHLITSDLSGFITEDTSTSYYIAKPSRIRTPGAFSEVKLGITHNYTFPGGDPDPLNKYRRDAWTDPFLGPTSEIQLVTPVWTNDEEILAINTTTVVMDLTGAALCQWMLVDSHREWARSNPQP